MPAWSSDFRRFTRSWHSFFLGVLIYCPSGKPSKVLNLVGTLASPCSDLFSVSLLEPLSHSTASLVKISRGHAEIKLETCWLCKWNIKMEFLKVPPPRSSIFEEGGSRLLLGRTRASASRHLAPPAGTRWAKSGVAGVPWKRGSAGCDVTRWVSVGRGRSVTCVWIWSGLCGKRSP